MNFKDTDIENILKDNLNIFSGKYIVKILIIINIPGFTEEAQLNFLYHNSLFLYENLQGRVA